MATRCRKCNRILKNPVAVAEGIGAVCKRKSGLTNPRSTQSEHDSDEIIPYDGGAFWIERKTAQTTTEFPGVRGTFNTDQIHAASGIKTNVPRQIYRHSPTGYNFGYGGSGPADWALNICLLLVHADDAYNLYQKFKFQFVAVGESDNERLEIPRADAEQWFREQGVNLLSEN